MKINSEGTNTIIQYTQYELKLQLLVLLLVK